jgi:hippurate hydrolase
LYGLPNVGYYNSKAGAVGSCSVHNPRYDFNDAALPIGASLFAGLVEKKLASLSTT